MDKIKSKQQQSDKRRNRNRQFKTIVLLVLFAVSIQTGYILAKPDTFSLYLKKHKQERIQDGLAFLEGQERKEIESLSMEIEKKNLGVLGDSTKVKRPKKLHKFLLGFERLFLSNYCSLKTR